MSTWAVTVSVLLCWHYRQSAVQACVSKVSRAFEHAGAQYGKTDSMFAAWATSAGGGSGYVEGG